MKIFKTITLNNLNYKNPEFKSTPREMSLKNKRKMIIQEYKFSKRKKANEKINLKYNT